MKKTKIKNIIFAVIVVLIAAGLAALPFLLESRAEESGAQASILSGAVTRGTIDTTLSGTGTVTEEDAVEVSVPDGVLITGYLVENGDFVSEGDDVATVDRVSVMTAISDAQDALETITESMADASSDTVSSSITAPCAARVKAVYASAGESVSDVVLRDGCLAVLSLDGTMAADVPAGNLTTGSAVTVTLESGKELSGTVEAVRTGTATVVFSDEYPEIGENVTVTDADGNTVGSAAAYIHSEWHAEGYTGTIRAVKCKAGARVSSGGTLFTLTDTSDTAEFDTLSEQRGEYEELMAELFTLYQDGTVKAPADGEVSGVDDSLVTKLSCSGNNAVLTLLAAHTPPDDGTDTAAYTNYVGYVQGIDTDKNTLTICIDPTSVTVNDYSSSTELGALSTDISAMTTSGTFSLYSVSLASYSAAGGSTPDPGSAGETEQGSADTASQPTGDSTEGGENAAGETPVSPAAAAETETSGTWTCVPGALTVNGIYLFLCDGSNNPVYAIRLGSAGSGDSGTGDTPAGGSGGSSGGAPSSGGSGGSSFGGISLPSGAASAAASGDDSSSLTRTVIASVTPQDTVTVSITVDELDVLSVSVGQEATVTLDAYPGVSYTGTVTSVGTSGTNSGGNSKYTAEITLQRTGGLLGGMNASVLITVGEKENVLTVPAEALVEEGTKTVIYTAYDEDSDTLTDPVTVETGVSDGSSVEILSGLSEGQTYWYSYYDTLAAAEQLASAPSMPGSSGN